MGAYEAAEIAFRGTHIIPATPEGDPVATLFAFTDIDGDMLAAFTADIPDVGKGINVRTSEAGCSIPDEVAVKMAAAILRKVVGPVYESPEGLAAEVVRLREGWDRLAAEIPRLYGRETAADLPHDSEYVTALHDVLVAMKRIERGDATLTSTPKGTPAPSLEERVRELEDLTEAMSAELEAHSRALDGK